MLQEKWRFEKAFCMNPESETAGGRQLGWNWKKKTLKVIMQNYPTDSPIAEKQSISQFYMQKNISMKTTCISVKLK